VSHFIAPGSDPNICDEWESRQSLSVAWTVKAKHWQYLYKQDATWDLRSSG
jgi:hypothetical protein